MTIKELYAPVKTFRLCWNAFRRCQGFQLNQRIRERGAIRRKMEPSLTLKSLASIKLRRTSRKLVLANDITERKRAEAALKLTRNSFVRR